MLSTKEFAERTGLTEKEVRARINKHRIKAKKINGVYQISEDPEKWLAKNKPNQEQTKSRLNNQDSEGTAGGSGQDDSSQASSHRMAEISQKAISRIKAVFESSFKDVLDRLKSHAESLPSDMRLQLSNEVTSQFEEHANQYAISFDNRVNDVIEHIKKLESKISDEKLKSLEDRISDLSKAQLSIETLDQYFKSRVEGHWEQMQGKLAPLEIIPAIENRIEMIEVYVESLPTRAQQDVIQEQLASEIVHGEQSRRYLKFSFIGIGIIAIVSIINLVLAL